MLKQTGFFVYLLDFLLIKYGNNVSDILILPYYKIKIGIVKCIL